ncbi:acyl-CoA thioesterase [Mesorhizobium sp. ES1-6]|uniref:acyl-CoA thioesterase n=1 Tax=Mesorhizobium sp. ES1-6 TaxID=2876626 RepID=UPI001CCCD8DE|nr:acyl-CoA thioesterase [Mesorhizobium sp. ES1-6]MBZ9803453.1 acyl-CoA thioesterase [Mesorhizobium sp. ES1-6]
MNEQIGRTGHVSLIGKPFIYRHIVSFEETNVVGNVYFARHVAWQGRCREMFLAQHAPSVIDDISHELRLVTITVNCNYFDEIYALDEIEITMHLSYIRRHRIGLDFDYSKVLAGRKVIVAHGFQEIGCMRKDRDGMSPIAPPKSLADALDQFAARNSQQQLHFPVGG